MAESIYDANFLQEFGYGLMPRKFSTTELDRIIYDEEEDVIEMYFVTDGIIGIGFR